MGKKLKSLNNAGRFKANNNKSIEENNNEKHARIAKYNSSNNGLGPISKYITRLNLNLPYNRGLPDFKNNANRNAIESIPGFIKKIKRIQNRIETLKYNDGYDKDDKVGLNREEYAVYRSFKTGDQIIDFVTRTDIRNTSHLIAFLKDLYQKRINQNVFTELPSVLFEHFTSNKSPNYQEVVPNKIYNKEQYNIDVNNFLNDIKFILDQNPKIRDYVAKCYKYIDKLAKVYTVSDSKEKYRGALTAANLFVENFIYQRDVNKLILNNNEFNFNLQNNNLNRYDLLENISKQNNSSKSERSSSIDPYGNLKGVNSKYIKNVVNNLDVGEFADLQNKIFDDAKKINIVDNQNTRKGSNNMGKIIDYLDNQNMRKGSSKGSSKNMENQNIRKDSNRSNYDDIFLGDNIAGSSSSLFGDYLSNTSSKK